MKNEVFTETVKVTPPNVMNRMTNYIDILEANTVIKAERE